MIVLGLTVVIFGALVIVLSILGDRSRRAPYNRREVVVHELAERYAVENYVLLSQAVGVLERLLDDDADLAVFTDNQREAADKIVRTFHHRQLPKG